MAQYTSYSTLYTLLRSDSYTFHDEECIMHYTPMGHKVFWIMINRVCFRYNIFTPQCTQARLGWSIYIHKTLKRGLKSQCQQVPDFINYSQSNHTIFLINILDNIHWSQISGLSVQRQEGKLIRSCRIDEGCRCFSQVFPMSYNHLICNLSIN